MDNNNDFELLARDVKKGAKVVLKAYLFYIAGSIVVGLALLTAVLLIVRAIFF